VDAKSVVIVGAGAVGTELAGEIATAQPDKQITLISTDDGLFPSYGAKMGASLVKKLKAKGVTVVLGQRVENLKQTKAPYFGSVTLTDGTKIDGDLIFPVIGSRAQTELLSELPGVEHGTLGRVKTDDWMRPSNFPNLFIASDIADVGDGMTIVATSRQNPWFIKTPKALLAGKSIEVLKPYTPWKKALVLIPLGPKQGNSWIFMLLGNFVTSAMKGKKIFIPKYKKAFGYSDK
jgi:NADH dehydrogenase FAD-containing subunit